ncbi:MAG: SAF domain-containing protein, partial [Acidimicrobiales bacterium]
MSAGSRSDVLVIADDVARFEPIERSDLRVVRVSADPAVDSVAAAELDDIVGRTAAVDLQAGV